MQYLYTIVSGVVDMSIVFVYFGTVNRSCPSRPPWVCGNISRQLFVNHWVGCKEHLQETLFLPHTYHTAVLLHISLPSSSDLQCAPGTSPCPRGPRDNVLAHQWKGAAIGVLSEGQHLKQKIIKKWVWGYLFIDMMPCFGFPLAVNYFHALDCHCVYIQKGIAALPSLHCKFLQHFPMPR